MDVDDPLDLLLSAAPVESHVGAIVVSSSILRIQFPSAHNLQDSPNACVTLAIPTGIFDFVRQISLTSNTSDPPFVQDILPKEEGLTVRHLGKCATRSDGVV